MLGSKSETTRLKLLSSTPHKHTFPHIHEADASCAAAVQVRHILGFGCFDLAVREYLIKKNENNELNNV